MPQKKIRIRTCIQNRIITLIKEVPSRIELLYTVLQTVASPLGHGTIKKEVIPQGVVLPFMAVRTRFELVVGLLLRQFSKLVVSATHPPFRVKCGAKLRIMFGFRKLLAIFFFG